MLAWDTTAQETRPWPYQENHALTPYPLTYISAVSTLDSTDQNPSKHIIHICVSHQGLHSICCNTKQGIGVHGINIPLNTYVCTSDFCLLSICELIGASLANSKGFQDGVFDSLHKGQGITNKTTQRKGAALSLQQPPRFSVNPGDISRALDCLAACNQQTGRL